MPVGITLDKSDNLYVADWFNNRVRQVVAATASFAATASGKITAQTISASITPAPAAQGQPGAVFVAALLPRGQFYLLGANGWAPYDPNHPAAFSLGQLQPTSATIVNGLNLTGLAGTTVYVGYGKGSSASQSLADLITNITYQPVYHVY